MKTILTNKSLLSIRPILVAFLGTGALLHAQDANWTGANSTDWNTGSNWAAGSVPTGTGTFGLTGSRSVDLGSPTSVGAMVFWKGGTWNFSGSPLTVTNAAVAAGTRPIQINSDIGITFQNQVVFNASAAAGAAQMGVAASASTVNLSFDGGISGNSSVSNFVFRTSTATLGVGGGSTITINGNISNIATFESAFSNHTLNISGSSSVSVETKLSGGAGGIALQLGNNGALGSGTLTLNTGYGVTLQALGASRTYANNVNFNSGYNSGNVGTFIISGDHDLTFSGTAALSRDSLFTVSAGRRFELGNTSGGKSILKDGAGTMVLSGSVAHTGSATVSGGTLLINGTMTGAATPTVNVQGVGTLGGNGTINRSVIFSDNGSGSGILNPGDALVNGGIGTLTVASAGVAARTVTFVDASQLNFDLKSLAEYDKLNITGNLTLDGVLNISDLGLDEIGSFKLIGYTGIFVDNGLILGTTPAGWEQSIRVDTASKSIYLDVTAIPEPSTYALLSGAAALAWVFGRGKAGKRPVA